MPGTGGWGPVTSKMQPRSSFQMDPRTIKKLNKRLQRSVQKALDAGSVLVRKEAALIKGMSQEQVPYDTGNLHDSAHFKVKRLKYTVTADVWYDMDKADYAWEIHEDIEREFLRGKKSQFLLDPMLEREGKMDEIWAKAFEGVFK